jgi:hypothetical protein
MPALAWPAALALARLCSGVKLAAWSLAIATACRFFLGSSGMSSSLSPRSLNVKGILRGEQSAAVGARAGGIAEVDSTPALHARAKGLRLLHGEDQ